MAECQALWSDGAAFPPAAYESLKTDVLIPASMAALAASSYILGIAIARVINCLRGGSDDDENLHDGIAFTVATAVFFGTLRWFDWYLPSPDLWGTLC